MTVPDTLQTLYSVKVFQFYHKLVSSGTDVYDYNYDHIDVSYQYIPAQNL